MSYINKKKDGKRAESEHVTDQEVLEEAIMSSDDESGNDFLEFNKDIDMDNPNIIVGLVFPIGDIYRKAVRMYSIKKGLKGFMKAVKRKFSIYITKPQAYRAKKMTLQTIQGQHKDQYLRQRDYCATIMSRNPDSAYLVVDRVAINRNLVFKRMDTNNQMYPVAIAIVETECKDSWSWFLDVLIGEIGDPEDRGWVFISDRQKGLVETFETKFPNVEHKFCGEAFICQFQAKIQGQSIERHPLGCC
ncbi:hypothetical protein ACH5RR_041775 [Cinchona calisaya]|uniref:MULE transposase domain-containing protein n=1 Tax=Cinchona calisaya TaxID=153742 RepID=A0ABD2XVR7_9GENT